MNSIGICPMCSADMLSVTVEPWNIGTNDKPVYTGFVCHVKCLNCGFADSEDDVNREDAYNRAVEMIEEYKK